MSEPLDKIQLNERTRARNDTLWFPFDWGGLMAPLVQEQDGFLLLSRSAIENYMAIPDEHWDIKSQQRDRTFQVDTAEVDQARQIADDKVATEREDLAIRKAMDEYTLSVKIYDAKVKSALMGAREFAAQVELEQLAVALSGAVLAVAKEGLHLKEVNAKIYYEYIQRAMVEADIAKSQVEVAKAHIRAVMADIEAGEADIKVIMAQIEQFTAQAQKAELQANVAMIFAEILTKKLSTVKLDIGQKEINAGFGYIQSRLTDALARLATQQIEESLKIAFEGLVLNETSLFLKDEKAAADLTEQAELNAREVFTYTETQTDQNIIDETALRLKSVVSREMMGDAKLTYSEQTDTKKTFAELLVNAAERYVHKNIGRQTTSKHRTTEYISGD